MVPNMVHGLMIDGAREAKKPWGACGPVAFCGSVHRSLGPPYPTCLPIRLNYMVLVRKRGKETVSLPACE